jgi:hypothetical protein
MLKDALSFYPPGLYQTWWRIGDNRQVQTTPCLSIRRDYIKPGGESATTVRCKLL